MTSADASRSLSLYILRNAEAHHQRTGQYLFNYLVFLGAGEGIRGLLWDPFYRDMNQYQLESWMDEHLIFDDHGGVVGVFGSDRILWENR